MLHLIESLSPQHNGQLLQSNTKRKYYLDRMYVKNKGNFAYIVNKGLWHGSRIHSLALHSIEM